MRDQVRARPVEAGLQQGAGDRTGSHCAGDVDREVPLALQQEKPGDGKRREGQDRDAADAGHVAGKILHPFRPHGIVRIGVFTECEKHGLVELAGLPFDDLVRDLEEEPYGKRSGRECGQRSDADAAAGGQERSNRQRPTVSTGTISSRMNA